MDAVFLDNERDIARVLASPEVVFTNVTKSNRRKAAERKQLGKRAKKKKLEPTGIFFLMLSQIHGDCEPVAAADVSLHGAGGHRLHLDVQLFAGSSLPPLFRHLALRVVLTIITIDLFRFVFLEKIQRPLRRCHRRQRITVPIFEVSYFAISLFGLSW